MNGPCLLACSTPIGHRGPLLPSPLLSSALGVGSRWVATLPARQRAHKRTDRPSRLADSTPGAAEGDRPAHQKAPWSLLGPDSYIHILEYEMPEVKTLLRRLTIAFEYSTFPLFWNYEDIFCCRFARCLGARNAP